MIKKEQTNLQDAPMDTNVNPNHAANLDASRLYRQSSEGELFDGNSCILIGEGGDENLRGGKGNDILIGGEGHDLIVGGGGDDAIFGDDAYEIATRDWSFAVTKSVVTSSVARSL